MKNGGANRKKTVLPRLVSLPIASAVSLFTKQRFRRNNAAAAERTREEWRPSSWRDRSSRLAGERHSCAPRGIEEVEERKKHTDSESGARRCSPFLPIPRHQRRNERTGERRGVRQPYASTPRPALIKKVTGHAGWRPAAARSPGRPLRATCHRALSLWSTESRADLQAPTKLLPPQTASFRSNKR